MKPTSTRRISASSLARRSNTAEPSAPETASAARLRGSWCGSSDPMGAQCNSSRPGGREAVTRLKRKLLPGGDEHVPGAAHGADGAGMCRVRLDLAAQTGNADVDRAVERFPFAVARHGEQLVARQHLVRMLDQRLEEVELHGGDRNLAALGVGQGARLQVEEAAADRDAKVGWLLWR